MKHFCAIVRHTKTMKTSSILFSAFVALAPATASQAEDVVLTGAPVQVAFLESEKFTDIGQSYQASEKEREHDLAVIRDYVVEHASRSLPPGHRLEVTFTDIDRAGEFEPWRGARWTDVRMVKEIYAPRMSLAFRVTDADGNVVKEGKRELRDSAFLSKLSIDRNDSYRHEKELLNDWLRKELPRERRR